MKKVRFFVFLLGMIGSTLLAQTNKASDPRVAVMLNNLNIEFQVTSNGAYEIEYNFASGRTQHVFIMSETPEYRGMEVRVVWSCAGVMGEDPDSDLLYSLMKESGSNIIGAWALVKYGKSYYLYYSIKLPLSHSPDDLRQSVSYAAEVADSKEFELTEWDFF